MGLERIPGQEPAKNLLTAWMKGGRLPHAVLLCGPEGTGKRHMALEVAKMLNCRGPAPPCGECVPCRKIEALSHPDLYVLLPGAKSGKDRDFRPSQRQPTLQYLEQGHSLARGHAHIPTDHVRFLQGEMGFAPLEGRRKIAIVFEAECLHVAGANSLLKILEEPPDHAVFLLVSGAPERLLPTVLSRCQQLEFRPLGHDLLRRQLDAEGIAGERLELAVRLGQGSLQRARRAAAGDYDESREQVEAFIGAGAEGRDAGYWEAVERLSGRENRGALEDFLQLCGLYLRDLFLLGCDRAEGVVQADRLDFLRPLQKVWSHGRLERAALEIDKAYDHLAHNVSVQLLLVDVWRLLRSGAAR